MKLNIIRELDLRFLKNNVLEKDENKRNKLIDYTQSTSFVDNFFKENNREHYLEELPYEFDLPSLIVSSNPSDDWKNAYLIFNSMKNLPTIYARDERLWAYLTHFIYWDYMKTRWYNSNIDLASRYFFKGNASGDTISVSSIPYTRNGIGRLWWGAYVVYNESLDNPLEYLPEIFVTQDLFVGICERSVSKNKNLTTSILKMVRKYKLNESPASTKLIREILKELNFLSAITMFEILEPSEIDNEVEKVVKEKMEELYTI